MTYQYTRETKYVPQTTFNKKFKNRKTIYVYIEHSLKKEFDKIADRKEITTSKLAGALITRYVKAVREKERLKNEM